MEERTTKQTSLSVIVAVYNEQYLVGASLSRLRVLGESPLLHSIQIIVVDDGSKDRSASALREFQAALQLDPWGAKFEWVFLRHPANRGKAAAIRTGLERAAGELTVFHDSDLEYHPADLLKMIPLFSEESADAVYGSRFLASDYRRVLFFRHSVGNQFLTFLCNLFSDLNLTDTETCYKMVRTSLLRSIPLRSERFGIEVELTLKLAKRAARIFEVPIKYSGRTYQEGKKIGWKDGFHALACILKFAISDQVYAADQYGSEILGRLNRAPKFTRWMADRLQPYVGDKVLEIGAGIGNMTMNFVPREVYWVSDVNPLYLDHLEKLCETRPYLRVCRTDASAADSYPQGLQFDTVICLNVVEHLEDDLGALRNIRDALQVNGRAIVLVPNAPRLYSTLDEVLGHFRRYTPQQLADTGARAGLHLETMLSFNRAGVLAWWLNGKVLHRRSFSLFQVKLLNSLTPLFRRIDSWLPLPSLSLVAVFRKRDPSPATAREAPAQPDLAQAV
jgi:2-polyprenyl-3-methyl-5-hydroxy-6-metoxy-1,4-benzoquinol methylase